MLESKNAVGILVNKFDLRNANRLIYKFSGDARIICLHTSVRLKIIHFLLINIYLFFVRPIFICMQHDVTYLSSRD